MVTQSVGAGPFGVVVHEELSLPDYISSETPPNIGPNTMRLGKCTINLTQATVWQPRPQWGTISAGAVQKHQPLIRQLIGRTAHLAVPLPQFPTVQAAVHHLAGRGNGLTPAGDDFLLGMMFALWSLHPAAPQIAPAIGRWATPRTTTISAAWLHAAAQGEAHITWHHLVNAIATDNTAAVQTAAQLILQFGHSSGADALSGFLTTTEALLTKHPPPSFWQIHN